MDIAVIDDHKLFAQMLRHTLQRLLPEAGITLCYSADQFFTGGFDGKVYDIMIIDILLPGAMDGIGMMDRLKETDGGKTKYILLTAVADLETIKTSVRKGANAYLTKDVEEDEFIEAINNVQEGTDGPYIQKVLRQKLIANLLLTEEEKPNMLLTKGEQEILGLLCSGKTPKEIAFEKSLSINTINQYLKLLKRKFKVHRTTDIILFAMQKGLYKK